MAEFSAPTAFDDPSGLRVGGRGVLRSTDGGRSWQNISHPLANLDGTSLALSLNGRWIFARTVGGVYRTRTEH